MLEDENKFPILLKIWVYYRIPRTKEQGTNIHLQDGAWTCYGMEDASVLSQQGATTSVSCKDDSMSEAWTLQRLTWTLLQEHCFLKQQTGERQFLGVLKFTVQTICLWSIPYTGCIEVVRSETCAYMLSIFTTFQFVSRKYPQKPPPFQVLHSWKVAAQLSGCFTCSIQRNWAKLPTLPGINYWLPFFLLLVTCVQVQFCFLL